MASLMLRVVVVVVFESCVRSEAFAFTGERRLWHATFYTFQAPPLGSATCVGPLF